MANLLQLRRDVRSAWDEKNPILAQGEMGIEIDASGNCSKYKIGNGTSTWSQLEYFSSGGGSGGSAGPGVLHNPEYFIGDGVQTTFPIINSITDTNLMFVYVNGMQASPVTYQYNAVLKSVVFNQAPENNSDIIVRYIGNIAKAATDNPSVLDVRKSGTTTVETEIFNVGSVCLEKNISFIYSMSITLKNTRVDESETIFKIYQNNIVLQTINLSASSVEIYALPVSTLVTVTVVGDYAAILNINGR